MAQVSGMEIDVQLAILGNPIWYALCLHIKMLHNMKSSCSDWDGRAEMQTWYPTFSPISDHHSSALKLFYQDVRIHHDYAGSQVLKT